MTKEWWGDDILFSFLTDHIHWTKWLKDLWDKWASVWVILDGFAWKPGKTQEKMLHKKKWELLSSDLKNVLAYFDSLTGPTRWKMEQFIVKNFSTNDLAGAIDDTTRDDLSEDATILLDRLQKERIDFLENDRAERLESVKVMKGLLNVDERGETMLELLIEENEEKLNEIKNISQEIKRLNQTIREKELRWEDFDDDKKNLEKMEKALEEKKKELKKDGLIPWLQNQKKYLYDIIRDNLWLNTSEVDFWGSLKTISRRVKSLTATSAWDGFCKRIKGAGARMTLNSLVKKLNWIKRPVDGVLLLFWPWLYTPGWDDYSHKHRGKIFKRWLRRNTGDWASFEYEFDKRVSEYLENISPSLEERASLNLIKARFEKIKQEFKKQLKEQYEASA